MSCNSSALRPGDKGDTHGTCGVRVPCPDRDVGVVPGLWSEPDRNTTRSLLRPGLCGGRALADEGWGYCPSPVVPHLPRSYRVPSDGTSGSTEDRSPLIIGDLLSSEPPTVSLPTHSARTSVPVGRRTGHRRPGWTPCPWGLSRVQGQGLPGPDYDWVRDSSLPVVPAVPVGRRRSS